jgi:hypothetical protein
MNGAAKAASVDRPTAGLPEASAIPRAAAMPTRRPVKLPGPEVELGAIEHACDQRHQRLGVATLHRHRFIQTHAETVGVE